MYVWALPSSTPFKMAAADDVLDDVLYAKSDFSATDSTQVEKLIIFNQCSNYSYH